MMWGCPEKGWERKVGSWIDWRISFDGRAKICLLQEWQLLDDIP